MPMARIFENSLINRKAVYRKALIKLPRPEFIVFYNGTEPFPEFRNLRLSDAYEEVSGFNEINLELEVKVYNINEGFNTRIVNSCEELIGYTYFVHRVRYHEAEEKKKGTALKNAIVIAIRKAIQDCITKGMLVDFWNNLTQEEINMVVSEWDMTTALEVEREEGFEKGMEKGMEKGVITTARNALEEGISLETVQKITGLDIDTLNKLSLE